MCLHMTTRLLKGKTLSNYDMGAVFKEFYSLEELINKNQTMAERNYITVRLVTVIEQFFQKVMEFLLKRYPDRGPQKVTVDTRLFPNIVETGVKYRWINITNLIISQTFPFQNTKDINDAMTTYGDAVIFADDLKQSKKNVNAELSMHNYNKFFDTRHNIVHTIEQRPHLDSRQYYKMTKELLDYTLKRINYYGFYEDIHQVLVHLDKKKEATKYNKISKHLHNETKNEYAIANKFLDDKDYENAIKHYDKVLIQDPNDIISLYCKGCSFLLFEHYYEAIESFERYLESSGDKSVCLYLGISLQAIKNDEDAIMYFRKALEYEPNDTEAYIKLLVSLSRIGLLPNVVNLADMLLKVEPENAAALKIKKLTQNEINRLNDNRPETT